MTHKWLKPNDGPSIWFLFFGIILCCTIVMMPAGLVMCFFYFYKDYTSKQARYEKEELDPQERSNAI